jgi:hypothetical protein
MVILENVWRSLTNWPNCMPARNHVPNHYSSFTRLKGRLEIGNSQAWPELLNCPSLIHIGSFNVASASLTAPPKLRHFLSSHGTPPPGKDCFHNANSTPQPPNLLDLPDLTGRRSWPVASISRHIRGFHRLHRLLCLSLSLFQV